MEDQRLLRQTLNEMQFCLQVSSQGGIFGSLEQRCQAWGCGSLPGCIHPCCNSAPPPPPPPPIPWRPFGNQTTRVSTAMPIPGLHGPVITHSFCMSAMALSLSSLPISSQGAVPAGRCTGSITCVPHFRVVRVISRMGIAMLALHF